MASRNVGRGSKIAVLERFSAGHSVFHGCSDPGTGVPTTLHRDLGHPGKFVPRHEVAHHVDVRVAGNGQIGFHLDAATADLLHTQRRGQCLGERHRFDARGPQNRAGLVLPLLFCLLVRRLDAGLAHVGDVHAEVSLDADPVESTFGGGRELATERREHPIVAVEEQYPCLVRVDGPELVCERVHRQFADLSG